MYLQSLTECNDLFFLIDCSLRGTPILHQHLHISFLMHNNKVVSPRLPTTLFLFLLADTYETPHSGRYLHSYRQTMQRPISAFLAQHLYFLSVVLLPWERGRQAAVRTSRRVHSQQSRGRNKLRQQWVLLLRSPIRAYREGRPLANFILLYLLICEYSICTQVW